MGGKEGFLTGPVLGHPEFRFQEKSSWYIAKMTNISEGVAFEIILIKQT